MILQYPFIKYWAPCPTPNSYAPGEAYKKFENYHTVLGMFIHHTGQLLKNTLCRLPLKNPSLLNSWVTASSTETQAR